MLSMYFNIAVVDITMTSSNHLMADLSRTKCSSSTSQTDIKMPTHNRIIKEFNVLHVNRICLHFREFGLYDLFRGSVTSRTLGGTMVSNPGDWGFSLFLQANTWMVS